MCGRYSITAPKAMRRLFKFANDAPNLRPNYNGALTPMLPIVGPGAASECELIPMR